MTSSKTVCMLGSLSKNCAGDGEKNAVADAGYGSPTGFGPAPLKARQAVEGGVPVQPVRRRSYPVRFAAVPSGDRDPATTAGEPTAGKPDPADVE